MSEARALTNFAGNAVATLLIGKGVGELDVDRARRVFAGEEPFDESLMVDDHDLAVEDTPPPATDNRLVRA